MSKKKSGTPDLVALGDLFEVLPYVEGKVLTVLDAVIEDKERRHAIKPLLQQGIWDGIDRAMFTEEREIIEPGIKLLIKAIDDELMHRKGLTNVPEDQH